MHSASILATLLLAGLTAAAPSTTTTSSSNRRDAILTRRSDSAEAQILELMPRAKSCTDEETADGCSTAAQAAPYFIDAMQKYNLKTAGEIAAVLAVTALESGELRYRARANHDNPGQGTSNLMQPPNVLLYASSFPELLPKVTEIMKGEKNATALPDADKDALLALVQVDKYNFGSGAWYLATQCDDTIKQNLQHATDEAWRAYLFCVTNVSGEDQDRDPYWAAAKKVFNLGG